MRIISGKFKKKKLLLPDSKTTRPLKDSFKENVFNLLLHSKLINFNFDKSIVFDFFSGSGSFGIECLSRGSEKVIFFEKEKKVINILNKNIQNLFSKNQFQIVQNDILNINFSNIFINKIDLIFLDPPFKYKYLKEVFLKLILHKEVIKNSLIAIHYESSSDFKFEDFLTIIVKKKYGRSSIIFAKIKN